MNPNTIGTCNTAFQDATEARRLEWAKTNWTALAGLCPEAITYLREHRRHVGLLSDGCLWGVGDLQIDSPNSVYRISPDFQLKKWFLHKLDLRIYETSAPVPAGFENMVCEITSAYALHLQAKPEKGFVLRMAKADDLIWDPGIQQIVPAEVDFTDRGPDDRGYRWCQVRKEPWIVRNVFEMNGRYNVDTARGTMSLDSASGLATFGGVQFKDQVDKMEWYMQTHQFLEAYSGFPSTIDPDARPAVPIRARFLNQ